MCGISVNNQKLIHDYYLNLFRKSNELNLSLFNKDELSDYYYRENVINNNSNINTIIFNNLFNINISKDKEIFIHFIKEYNLKLVSIYFYNSNYISDEIINLIKYYCKNIININKKSHENRFITITLIKYDNIIEISHNNIISHSEINCWNKIHKLIKKSKKKKKDIYITEIRCRYNNQFEYSFSQPCKHCTLYFQKISNSMYKQNGSRIKINWSLNNDSLCLTPFIYIDQIKNSTLSSKYAIIYNDF